MLYYLLFISVISTIIYLVFKEDDGYFISVKEWRQLSYEKKLKFKKLKCYYCNNLLKGMTLKTNTYKYSCHKCY